VLRCVAPARACANAPERLSSSAVVALQFHEKPRDADGSEQADALLGLARGLGAPLGVLACEKADGGLSALWHARLAAAALEQTDVAGALARIMAPKEESELQSIRRASHLSSSVLEKFVVNKLESVVDEEGEARARPPHAALHRGRTLTRACALTRPDQALCSRGQGDQRGERPGQGARGGQA
jgi:Xaa-Pro aminopeptidase